MKRAWKDKFFEKLKYKAISSKYFFIENNQKEIVLLFALHYTIYKNPIKDVPLDPLPSEIIPLYMYSGEHR